MPFKKVANGVRQQQVRDILKKHPGGLTTPEMEKLLELREGQLSDVPKWTAQVYIAGYHTSHNERGQPGKPPAIWKLHTDPLSPVPQDAKKPPLKNKPRIKKPKPTPPEGEHF